MPLAPAWGQQPTRVPVVGVLITHAAVNDPVVDYLRTGLREFGYEDGRNIRLEIVTAAGQLDRLPALARDLVRNKVDIIVAPNEMSIRTAQKATSAIPIVMAGWGYDPVALQLIESFGRPGGNITGLYSAPAELDAKRLELLKEVLPRAERVAVLWEDPFGSSALAGLQRASEPLGLRLELIQVHGLQELEMAFKAAKRKRADAVLLVWSPTFYVHRERVAALALDARLPTFASTLSGAMVAYSADSASIWKRVGYYIDRLLKGARPGELPVEQVAKLKLVVDLKTAKALGVTIPQSILVRADEVIQ
jgi:putative ABC transport system substrate-binding protein